MRRIALSLFLVASLAFGIDGFKPTNVPNGLGVGEAIRPYNDGQVTYNLTIECDTLEATTLDVGVLSFDELSVNTANINNIDADSATITTLNSSYIDMGSASEIKIGYDNTALGQLLFGGSKTEQISGGSYKPAYIYTSNGGGSGGLFNSAGNIILDSPSYGGYIGFISSGEIVGGIGSSGLSLLSGNVIYLHSGDYAYQIGSSPDNYFYIKQMTTGNIIEGSPSNVSINVPLNVDGNIIADTFTGTTGTFSGGISGTTGTFSGGISGTDVTAPIFIGDLQGNALTATFANSASFANVAGEADEAVVLQTARTIAFVPFDGSANISLNNNSITNGAGYTSNVGDLVSGGALGTPSSGTLTNCTFPTLNQNTTGQAGTVATITGLAPDTATSQATQPNITSVGTLTSLTSSGGISATTGAFSGSVELGSSIYAGNLDFKIQTDSTAGRTRSISLVRNTNLGGAISFDEDTRITKGLVINTTGPYPLTLETNNTTALTLGTDQSATFTGDVSVGGTLSMASAKHIDFPTGIGIGNRPTNLDVYGVVIGRDAGLAIEAGAVGNVGIGYSALRNLTIGDYNSAYGNGSGSKLTTGTGNTLYGDSSGYNLTTQNGNLHIGRWAGKYETSSYKLFIDAIDRGSEATGRTNSMMYGVFHSTPASQTLALNAQVSALSLTSSGGISATTGTFSGGISGTIVREAVTTIVSSATPTINSDNCAYVTITALATNITSMTTNLSGTPTNFQKLIFRIKDNGTSRSITWGSDFEAKGVALPTATTASKVLTTGFIYDTVTSKWGCVASVEES